MFERLLSATGTHAQALFVIGSLFSAGAYSATKVVRIEADQEALKHILDAKEAKITAQAQSIAIETYLKYGLSQEYSLIRQRIVDDEQSKGGAGGSIGSEGGAGGSIGSKGGAGGSIGSKGGAGGSIGSKTMAEA